MILRLALLQLWRERSTPLFKILSIAFFIAIFATTVITSLTKSFDFAINNKAKQLLGADLILQSAQPIDADTLNLAKKYSLNATTVTEFFSMLMSEDNAILTSIDSLGNKYPLNTKFKIDIGNKIISIYGPPKSKEIWLEKSIAYKLNKSIGQSVELGNARFTITGILEQFPVVSSRQGWVAPKAYINQKDVASTGVLTLGSRVLYKLALVGPSDKLIEFKEEIAATNQTIKLTSPQSSQAGLQRVLTYSERYLAICLLCQIALAGIAIAICANVYAKQKTTEVAIWRVIGANNRLIMSVNFLMLAIVGAGLLLASVGFGLLVAKLILAYGINIGIDLQLPYLSIIGIGALTGLLILVGFAFLPIWDLRRISPSSIFKKNSQIVTNTSAFGYILAIFSVYLCFVTFIGNVEVASRLGAQLIIVGTIMFSICWGLWYVFVPVSKIGGITWRFSVSYLLRYKWSMIIQWLVFGLVIMLLLIIQIVKSDILSKWQAKLPPDTPNAFIINIQEDQLKGIDAWFKGNGINNLEYFPIVSARLSRIKGQEVRKNSIDYSKPRGLNRPIYLTWMETLPSDYDVVSGKDWQQLEQTSNAISIEKNFARSRGLKIGDSLSFQIGSDEITGTIVQIREVNWQSLKPNFFVIFKNTELKSFPHSYITSVRLEEQHKKLIPQLVSEFVEISVFDFDAILTAVIGIMDKLSYALNGLISIIFVLGLLVLYSIILSSNKERIHESAVLLALGANKQLIRNILIIEYALVGVVAGLLASSFGYLLAKDIATMYFNIKLASFMKWAVIGTVTGVIISVVFGLLGSKRIFKTTPLYLLRNS